MGKLTGREEKLDVDYYRSNRVSSADVAEIYNISRATLKNYRRGYYYRGDQKIYYYQTGAGKTMNLRHIPQVDGEPVWYMVSWINEWLKLIGQESFIPEELKSL